MKIVVNNSVSLDGVMQAPGRADEDTRDGFAHGGWAVPYADQMMAETVGARMGQTGALLFGRRTYEDFAGFWPTAPQPNPFTALLDDARKYVASTTLADPLPWQNSILLAGDAADAVAGLKQEVEGNLMILGSGELIRSLMARDLIDEYRLLIHPLVLGAGRRLFPDDGPRRPLALADSVITTTGVVMATYRPA